MEWAAMTSHLIRCGAMQLCSPRVLRRPARSLPPGDRGKSHGSVLNMKLLFSPESSRLRKIGTLLLCPAIALQACGPDFPNRYLDLPAETILAAPEGFFAVEIERLAPAPRQYNRNHTD